MTDAATAWLDSLDADQRRTALFPFPSDEERRLWFYTPTDHGGLTLAAMSPSQEGLAMQLLASAMSAAGYATVATIIGLENILDRTEGFRMRVGDRERTRHPGMYFVRVFGTPAATGAWSWRFGGHHVSINALVVDGEVRATTPCFLGADPADTQLLGPHWLRPLGGVEDLGRELVRSFDETQFATASISPVAPPDIIGANRPKVSAGDANLTLADVWRGEMSEQMQARMRTGQEILETKIGYLPEHKEALRLGATPAGLTATALSASQQDVLRQLLDTYVTRMADDLAEAESAKYSGIGIERVSFAWAGGLERGQPHYYRVTGPRLLVEYDNTQNDVNHIHSVWRDPEGDFGMDVLANHYRHSH